MKAVILAGGLGSRLSEETSVRPKPMVEVGGKPILWHIMKVFEAGGVTDFVVCLGYKGYVIKEYFANYALHTADVTFDFATGQTHLHGSTTEPWTVTLVETGEGTQTGGRLKRVIGHVAQDDTFLFTYGDGVTDLDVQDLLKTHRAHGKKATVTGIQPPGRFGALALEGDRVESFQEKPKGDGGWINGGFFALHPSVADQIEQDSTVWEAEPVERLAREDELRVHRHRGFWKSMDTLRDRRELEDMWASGRAPWATWRP